MKAAALVLCLLSVAVSNATAQRLRLGAFVEGGCDVHSTAFQSLPGTFSCSPGFGTSVGSGFGLGAVASFQSWAFGSTRLFRQSHPVVRIGYWSTGASFVATEHQPILLDTQRATATLEHRAVVVMPSARVNVGLGTLVGDLPLYVEPTVWASFALPARFEQGEYLVEPANRGRFPETGTRIRNTSSGRLQSVEPVQIGLGLTSGWELSLSPTFTLRPEVGISVSLTSALSSNDWRIFSLRAGLSLHRTIVAPESEPSQPEPPAPEPTPPPTLPTPAAKPTLTLLVRFVTRDSSGMLIPVERVTLETYYRRHIRPLLPYVFFDEGSATIPSRYVLLDSIGVATFDEAEIASLSTLEAYYHLLNIVAARLRSRPNAELTITGCTNNTGVESNRLDLARQRAERVRTYLHKRWGIDTGRLHIVVRSLPEHPSPVGHPDGNAENARVELSSNDAAILDAIVGIEQQSRVIPPRLYAQIEAAPSQLSHWEWTLANSDTVLTRQSGSGAIPTLIPVAVQWNRLGSTRIRGEIDGSLERYGSNALTARHHQDIVVALRSDSISPQREVFSLILFDFDDATITPAHQSVLEHIGKRIRPSSRITISGYTDQLGDALHNRRLAERRAVAVARALGITDRAQIQAIGSQVLLYDNATPEGRFYSRTIEVELEHPQ